MLSGSHYSEIFQACRMRDCGAENGTAITRPSWCSAMRFQLNFRLIVKFNKYKFTWDASKRQGKRIPLVCWLNNSRSSTGLFLDRRRCYFISSIGKCNKWKCKSIKNQVFGNHTFVILCDEYADLFSRLYLHLEIDLTYCHSCNCGIKHGEFFCLAFNRCSYIYIDEMFFSSCLKLYVLFCDNY